MPDVADIVNEAAKAVIRIIIPATEASGLFPLLPERSRFC